MSLLVPKLEKELPVFDGDTSYWEEDIHILADAVAYARKVEARTSGYSLSPIVYDYTARLPEIIGFAPDEEVEALSEAQWSDPKAGTTAKLALVKDTLDIIRKDLEVVSKGKYSLSDGIDLERNQRTKGQPLRGDGSTHIDPLGILQEIDVPRYGMSTRPPATLFYQGPARLLLRSVGGGRFDIRLGECFTEPRWLKRTCGNFVGAPAKAIVRFGSAHPHASPTAEGDVDREYLRASGWSADWDQFLSL